MKHKKEKIQYIKSVLKTFFLPDKVNIWYVVNKIKSSKAARNKSFQTSFLKVIFIKELMDKK